MNTEGNDEAFGPVSASRLDFTLLFEHTVLGILPTGLLLATTPLYFYICTRRPLYTRTGYILWAELVSFSYPSPLLFQLMRRILDCISNDDAGPYERAGLIAATLLTFATRAIARGSYKHASYRLVTATRGVLIAAMADKQMRLTHTEAKKSAISTLMTADVEGIEATLPSVHDLWAFFVDIGFGLYFLSRYISLATISIFAPFLCRSCHAAFMSCSANAWNASIQSRVSKMTNILAQQIPIRMIGLGPIVGKFA
ncbi:hypothetical protein NHJ6243_000387 [Beauveria neobassiana]